MNNKFLILTSLLIALLCHLFVFNYCTIVFPIDPAAPKPKFFFLGPILKQGDIKQVSLKKPAPESSMTSDRFGSIVDSSKNIRYETGDPGKNLFSIQAINKPLIPQTVGSEEKVVLKSTFEAALEENQNETAEVQRPDQELGIRPYRSLRSRRP